MMMEATANKGDGAQPAQRKMRNYLLDKRFQLSWVLRVALATAIIVTVMGYFLYGTVAEATDQILAQKMGDLALTQSAFNAFVQQNERDKSVTLWTLVCGLAGIILFLSLLTIIVTHKIAGPVYKMKKLFQTVDGGHLQMWARLRKGDELQDVFKEFDDMIRRLREHRRADVQELKAIHGLIAGIPQASEAGTRLGELASRYSASIKMED
jgi:nitrogen fixation/metabolism regulation signal transduction histidine kinase